MTCCRVWRNNKNNKFVNNGDPYCFFFYPLFFRSCGFSEMKAKEAWGVEIRSNRALTATVGQCSIGSWKDWSASGLHQWRNKSLTWTVKRNKKKTFFRPLFVSLLTPWGQKLPWTIPYTITRTMKSLRIDLHDLVSEFWYPERCIYSLSWWLKRKQRFEMVVNVVASSGTPRNALLTALVLRFSWLTGHKSELYLKAGNKKFLVDLY